MVWVGVEIVVVVVVVVVMLHAHEVVGIGNPWGVGVRKSKTHLGRNPKLGGEGKENRDPDGRWSNLLGAGLNYLNSPQYEILI